VILWKTERCFVSRQNRESGSRKFFCDGRKIIVDHNNVEAGAMFLFGQSPRQKPRGGVAENFRQEIYV
jgi:Tol biopolymer transport system component